MPPRTRASRKRQVVDEYSSDSSLDELLEFSDEYASSEEERKAPRVPKKKLKKSTEERIKQVVGDDSQNVDEDDDIDMVDDEGEPVNSNNNINTKRLLDARSKKAKRMDWEQGFFYLPKFDCYLPRHILHMILDYIPPFPYFLNIRSISQQWLDDFDTVICPNVKELDLVQRNDIDYELVKYNYPWYDPSCDTRRNNACIRFLTVLFPNVEKLIVPAIGANVYVPNNILRIFEKLEKMEIFYVTPITLDDGYPFGEIPLTYQQDITNIQLITENQYLTRFCSHLVMVYDSDYSELRKVSNCIVPKNVTTLFKYLVKEQHFSLKRLNVLSLPTVLYSKELIDFILEENVIQVERGYGAPEIDLNSKSLYIRDDEINNYMYEKQFFKKLVSTIDIESFDWGFISHLLSNLNSLTVFKMLFDQCDFPLVLGDHINPLLFLIKNNTSSQIPEIIEFLCTLNPSLITLGDERGFVNGNTNNLNILEFCINKYRIDENIISSLIKVGCDVKFVCPTTGNNLIHIHPYSPSLIDAVPVEYLQMKNNKGYNPLERLVKRIEIEKNISQDNILLGIEAFGKAYSKFGWSINDLKFEKNQNLLHKFSNLPYGTGVVEKLIQLKVDANAIDEDGNIPLFYFLKNNFKSNNNDTSLFPFIDTISEETLTKRYNGKSFLTNIIERIHFEEPHPSRPYSIIEPPKEHAINLLENLLSRGCNLNEAISELSNTYYEKGNLDHNRSLFLMQLLFSLTRTNLGEFRKIFKYFDNFKDTLIKTCIIKGTVISPLLYLLSVWSSPNRVRDCKLLMDEIIYSENNPLIPASLLENIIDHIPNKKIDVLYYSIISSSFSINWQYLEAILGIKDNNKAVSYSYKSMHYTEMAKHIASYRHEDEVYGNLNIVQLAIIMGNMDILRQIHLIFSATPNILDDFYKEPFKNGTNILDELAKRGLYSEGDLYVPLKQKWTIKHFRLAYESNHFPFCYNIISDNSYTHDFTKEEILQILIGVLVTSKIDQFGDKNGQMGLTKLLASHFSDLSFEERFKLFSRRFNIVSSNKAECEKTEICHSYGWLTALERTLVEANSAWSKLNGTTMKQEYHLSLLDICYWSGLIYLLLYLVLGDTTGRKKKNILVNSDLTKDLLLSWITTKCDHVGKTLIHFACQDIDYSADLLSSKSDMVKDLVNYLSTVDREDALNIQDNELKTAAFYSLQSGICTSSIFAVTDLSLKNTKGETVKDVMNDEEKLSYAKFFEEKKEKSSKKSTTKRKKKDDKEEMPKKKTASRKKQESDDEEFEMSDDYKDKDFKEKPARKARSSRKMR